MNIVASTVFGRFSPAHESQTATLKRRLKHSATSRFCLLAVFLNILALITACTSQSPEEAQLKLFADAFRKANQASDIEPMLALYELEGTSEQTTTLLKNALLYELGLPIQSIDFEPLSGAPEEQIQYKHQGVHYGPTVEPLHRMRVRYATEDRFESLFTIGRNKSGDWKITSSRPVPED